MQLRAVICKLELLNNDLSHLAYIAYVQYLCNCASLFTELNITYIELQCLAKTILDFNHRKFSRGCQS